MDSTNASKKSFSAPMAKAIAISFAIHKNMPKYVKLQDEIQSYNTEKINLKSGFTVLPWNICNRSIIQYHLGLFDDQMGEEFIDKCLEAAQENAKRRDEFSVGNNKWQFFLQIADQWPKDKLDWEKFMDKRAEVDEFTDRFMLDILTNSLSDFDSQMIRICENEDDVAEFRDLGLIAYLPYWYENIKKIHDEIDARMELGIESDYIGEIGERVKLDFHVNNAFKSKSMPGSAVIKGHSEGNLIIFYTSIEMEKFPVDTDMVIVGKVKDHMFDKQAQSPLTKLNYVKIYKE